VAARDPTAGNLLPAAAHRLMTADPGRLMAPALCLTGDGDQIPLAHLVGELDASIRDHFVQGPGPSTTSTPNLHQPMREVTRTTPFLRKTR
jgi:hypothetical protein